MKNLIIIDVDVDYATLCMTGSKPWRGGSASGFTSVEYFYLADDELARQLTSTNLFFTTGDDITILDILAKAGAQPFAAKASGVRSYARFHMEDNSGEDDDQLGRIRAMIRLADQEEGGVSNIYRFAHIRNYRKEKIAYFDKDKRQPVDMSKVSEIRYIGMTEKNFNLLDSAGKVVASNPKQIHLFRMYGYWQTLDRNGGPVGFKLAAPPVEDIQNIKLDDPNEVRCWSRGGELEDLFEFLNIRKMAALVNKANSWRTKTQSKYIYYLNNILKMNFGRDLPVFDTQEDAEKGCIDFCKNVVIPEMKRVNPSLRCVKYDKGGFRIAVRVSKNAPEAKTDIEVDLFDQHLWFPPGREYDMFNIRRAVKKTPAENQQKDALDESQLDEIYERHDPLVRFWAHMLDEIG